MDYLSDHAKHCHDKVWNEKNEEYCRYFVEVIFPSLNKVNNVSRKFDKVEQEVREYVKNVTQKVRDQAVKEVTAIVTLVVEKTLRSSLKASSGSEPAPTSPKWMDDALSTFLRGMHAKHVSHFSVPVNVDNNDNNPDFSLNLNFRNTKTRSK